MKDEVDTLASWHNYGGRVCSISFIYGLSRHRILEMWKRLFRFCVITNHYNPREPGQHKKYG